MILTPNSGPSLARLIEQDRRNERWQKIIARIEREEDERVRAYRENAGKTENESGSASHQDGGDDSETSETRTASPDPENRSPPSPDRNEKSRGSISTSPANQSGHTGFGQDDFGPGLLRRKPIPASQTTESNPATPIPEEDVLKSPELCPEQLGERIEGKGVFSDVDRIISGSNLYSQRERTRSATNTTTSLPHRRQTAPPTATLAGSPDLSLSTTTTTTTTAAASLSPTALSSPSSPPPLELDGSPILELSAQLSVKKKDDDNTKPSILQRKGARLRHYIPYRKLPGEGGMSVQELQARRVVERAGVEEEKAGSEEEREVERKRVEVAVRGVEMRRMFDPKVGGR
ncbi:hypothetical protein FGG08_003712 [Glutinoglossum americanum]|uniref:Uncharacterized protein n=1 Tax=Glutinoglossum americanum TaxID=1670608 RepID=A0A9P8I734_9PEZI|nr:hypothetical protein FGG08_003712 [Glutinoglossum americanum]